MAIFSAEYLILPWVYMPKNKHYECVKSLSKRMTKRWCQFRVLLSRITLYNCALSFLRLSKCCDFLQGLEVVLMC